MANIISCVFISAVQVIQPSFWTRSMNCLSSKWSQIIVPWDSRTGAGRLPLVVWAKHLDHEILVKANTLGIQWPKPAPPHRDLQWVVRGNLYVKWILKKNTPSYSMLQLQILLFPFSGTEWNRFRFPDDVPLKTRRFSMAKFSLTPIRTAW